MTETPSSTTASTASADAAASGRKRGGGLSSMLIADLKSMAQGMGIAGAGSMKKAQLVEAIKAAQSGSRPSGPAQDKPAQESKTRDPRTPDSQADQASSGSARQRTRQRSGGQEAQDGGKQSQQGQDKQGQDRQQGQDKQGQDRQQGQDKQGQDRQQGQDKQGQQTQAQQQKQDNKQQDSKQQDNKQQGQQHGQQGQSDDDDGQGSRRNRRRRGRDRDRRGGCGEPDTTVLEDDVLVPAAGILDVLDNYAFVRTSGYLPGTDDVYLSLSMVRRYGLRRGDAIAGQVRQPREGERREKFNPMVRIDSVNGADPESAVDRPDFAKGTPVHATERLRLETTATGLVGRVVDVVAPLGKGQRGLLVAEPGAGRTSVLQAVAGAVTANNPECHLMVVLVDERPEEVTDYERSVKGEVIASTFDRPASDHTMVAELAIERAKRLVELGHDVVVLLDSITALGRAHNVTAQGSGRVLPGGVDAAALHPPKKFFGAARKVEDGGSLTILATALAGTGSKADEVILEELRGTANTVLLLSRDLADKDLVPAVDVAASGTPREDLLLGEEEREITQRLRRSLSGKDGAEALSTLLDGLRSTQTNIEYLTRSRTR